jgi:hypothetical protein
MSQRIAGCDLGKASASFVIASLQDDGGVVIEDTQYLLHEGKPFEAFERWYREQDVAGCAALAATGTYADDLTDPVMILPEDSCQEAALGMQPDLADAIPAETGAGLPTSISTSRTTSAPPARARTSREWPGASD